MPARIYRLRAYTSNNCSSIHSSDNFLKALLVTEGAVLVAVFLLEGYLVVHLFTAHSSPSSKRSNRVASYPTKQKTQSFSPFPIPLSPSGYNNGYYPLSLLSSSSNNTLS